MYHHDMVKTSKEIGTTSTAVGEEAWGIDMHEHCKGMLG